MHHQYSLFLNNEVEFRQTGRQQGWGIWCCQLCWILWRGASHV